jgi:hypothetical protein
MRERIRSHFWTLVEKWASFARALLDPWSVVSLIVTIVLFWASSATEDHQIGIILSGLAAVTAGVLGAIWTKSWLEMNEERVIVVRGRSAIRDLKLLLRNVSVFQLRLLHYQDQSKSGVSAEVSSLWLEEIAERTLTIQEEVVNAIEHWTDIVPEADIQTQIGAITELRERIASISNHRDRLQSEFSEAQGKSAQQASKLQEALDSNLRELTDLRHKLSQEQARVIGTSSASLKHLTAQVGGLAGSLPLQLGAEVSSSLLQNRCKSCGKSYALGLLNENGYCPDCAGEGRRYYGLVEPDRSA